MTRILTVFIISSLITMSAFSQTVGTEIDKIKTFEKQGNYSEIVRSSLFIIDQIYFKAGTVLLENLPELSGIRTVGTNFNYSVQLADGDYDMELSAQKVFSNQTELVTLTADTSVSALQRYTSLTKSFDFLSDPGDFKKYKITNRGVEQTFLTGNGTAYLMFPWETNDTDIRSGVLLTLETVFYTNLVPEVQETMLTQQSIEILQRFNSKDVSAYFK